MKQSVEAPTCCPRGQAFRGWFFRNQRQGEEKRQALAQKGAEAVTTTDKPPGNGQEQK